MVMYEPACRCRLEPGGDVAWFTLLRTPEKGFHEDLECMSVPLDMGWSDPKGMREGDKDEIATGDIDTRNCRMTLNTDTMLNAFRSDEKLGQSRERESGTRGRDDEGT